MKYGSLKRTQCNIIRFKMKKYDSDEYFNVHYIKDVRGPRTKDEGRLVMSAGPVIQDLGKHYSYR